MSRFGPMYLWDKGKRMRASIRLCQPTLGFLEEFQVVPPPGALPSIIAIGVYEQQTAQQLSTARLDMGRMASRM